MRGCWVAAPCVRALGVGEARQVSEEGGEGQGHARANSLKRRGGGTGEKLSLHVITRS